MYWKNKIIKIKSTVTLELRNTSTKLTYLLTEPLVTGFPRDLFIYTFLFAFCSYLLPNLSRSLLLVTFQLSCRLGVRVAWPKTLDSTYTTYMRFDLGGTAPSSEATAGTPAPARASGY